MTVPFIPDADDKLCRYTGSAWNCAANSFDAGSQTITRNNVTQFSLWTAGNVGPTAVTLYTAAISVPDQSWMLLLILLMGLVTAVVTLRRRVKGSNK